MMRKLLAVSVAGLILLGSAGLADAAQAKNVILVISDGIGFNGWEAARYYEGGLPYDNAGFNFYGCTTYMHNVWDNDLGRELDSRNEAAGVDAATKNWTAMPQGYDPTQMWSDFNYHRGTYKNDYNSFTDSAAAATALYTGVKTYNSAVSYGVDGKDIRTIAEISAAAGKATGSVSSVQFNHATPGCVDAHAYYRYNKTEIASEMVNSDLDVIMGGDGYVDTESEYPGMEAGWMADAAANGYSTAYTEAEWNALYGMATPPAKLAALFDGSTLDGRAVPTLREMTEVAVKSLSQESNGFFLMVEGGAVDWQNHANDADLMMREQVDFDNSVTYVMDWIENNGGWEQNTLIVTSDHETGGIWGPGTLMDDNGTPSDGANDGTHLDDTIAMTWQKVVDNGAGNMPGLQYTTGGHTNVLVPLWVKGVGASEFDALVDGNDPTADTFWGESQGWDWNGDYVDNTDVFTVMDKVVPEPATLAVLSLGGLAVLRRRR